MGELCITIVSETILPTTTCARALSFTFKTDVIDSLWSLYEDLYEPTAIYWARYCSSKIVLFKVDICDFHNIQTF